MQLKSNAREVLGVLATDTTKAIVYAYRRLSLAYHPDRNKSPMADAEMACITKAKEILLR